MKPPPKILSGTAGQKLRLYYKKSYLVYGTVLMVPFIIYRPQQNPALARSIFIFAARALPLNVSQIYSFTGMESPVLCKKNAENFSAFRDFRHFSIKINVMKYWAKWNFGWNFVEFSKHLLFKSRQRFTQLFQKPHEHSSELSLQNVESAYQKFIVANKWLVVFCETNEANYYFLTEK